MSDNTLTDTLRKELSALRDAAVAAQSDGPRPDVTAVVKLFRGLSLEAWSHLARDLDLDSFLAFPLQGDLYPLAQHLLRTLEELAAKTGCDPATGLPDQRGFSWALEIEVERAVRNQSSLSLAVLTLGLSAGIETRGEACLDTAMAQAAAVITASMRKYDFVARIGGNKFAMLFPDLGQQRTRNVLDRLQVELCALDARCQDRHTTSVGIASIKGRIPMTGKELMEMADGALLQAKERGGSSIVMAPIPDIAMALKSTLVHSREKQFLFTGS